MEKLRTNLFPVEGETYTLQGILEVMQADMDREMLFLNSLNQTQINLENLVIGQRIKFYNENTQTDSYLRFILEKTSETNYSVVLVQPVIRNDRLGCTGFAADEMDMGYGFMSYGGNSGSGILSRRIHRSIESILSGSIFKK